jgi:hypothetical protein
MADDRHGRREGDTDAAALAAGGLAIVLTTYVDEGRYDLFGAIVSLTLLTTLLAYLLGKERSGPQRAALAGVAGLVATPLVGFAIEFAQAADRAAFFSCCEISQRVKSLEETELASTVGELPIAIAWAVVAALVGGLDHWLVESRRATDPPPDTGR